MESSRSFSSRSWTLAGCSVLELRLPKPPRENRQRSSPKFRFGSLMVPLQPAGLQTQSHLQTPEEEPSTASLDLQIRPEILSWAQRPGVAARVSGGSWENPPATDGGWLLLDCVRFLPRRRRDLSEESAGLTTWAESSGSPWCGTGSVSMETVWSHSPCRCGGGTQ